MDGNQCLKMKLKNSINKKVYNKKKSKLKKINNFWINLSQKKFNKLIINNNNKSKTILQNIFQNFTINN